MSVCTFLYIDIHEYVQMDEGRNYVCVHTMHMYINAISILMYT